MTYAVIHWWMEQNINSQFAPPHPIVLYLSLATLSIYTSHIYLVKTSEVWLKYNE